MPSDKAIEAKGSRIRNAVNEIAYALWESGGVGPEASWRYGPPNYRLRDKFAWAIHAWAMRPLADASAIDGDFNDGVEAAKAAVEELRQPAIAGAFDAHNARAWNGVLDIVRDALENLKR